MISIVGNRKPLTRRIGAALAALAALVAALLPLSAMAHPLGNFSVNRYSRLKVGTNALLVRYVLDMAEVPAFQEMQRIDIDRDGKVNDGEASAYTARRIAGINQGLRLTVNGAPAYLQTRDHSLSFPDGQGGLKTLRLEITFAAPLPAAEAITLAYQDANEPDRQGWREIVARAAAGRALKDANVPTADVSDELRAYPDDMLASPLNVRSAQLSAAPAAGAAGDSAGARAAIERSRNSFAALIAADNLTPPVMLLSLLVAFGLGAAHALAPGHGKTVVAAYLVGARGTARHAVALGLTVTATHTIGVFALGLVTLFLSQYILPERLYPWLGVISGLLVVAIGVGLVRARLNGLRTRPAAPAREPVPAARELVAAGAPVGAEIGHRHADGAWHSHDGIDAHTHEVGADHDHRSRHDHDSRPRPRPRLVRRPPPSRPRRPHPRAAGARHLAGPAGAGRLRRPAALPLGAGRAAERDRPAPRRLRHAADRRLQRRAGRRADRNRPAARLRRPPVHPPAD